MNDSEHPGAADSYELGLQLYKEMHDRIMQTPHIGRLAKAEVDFTEPFKTALITTASAGRKTFWTQLTNDHEKGWHYSSLKRAGRKEAVTSTDELRILMDTDLAPAMIAERNGASR
jgi:hypothetical protein